MVDLIRRILRALGFLKQPRKADPYYTPSIIPTNNYQIAPPTPTNIEKFPYHLRDDFLSPAELSFYSVLRTVVGDQSSICVKVGLSDLFYVPRNDPSDFRTYTNKIDRKHVDFVLCDPMTMRPLVGIELDDRSHQRQDRQERDQFVDQVFEAARLPLLRLPVKRAYQTTDLTTQIMPYIKSMLSPLSSPVNLSPIETGTKNEPTCPKCGGAMSIRVAKKGANAGNQFWGCNNYPNCRTMLPYHQPTF